MEGRRWSDRACLRGDSDTCVHPNEKYRFKRTKKVTPHFFKSDIVSDLGIRI
jgi:hypothetical protein